MADILSFLKKAAPWTAQALSIAAPGPVGIVAGIVAKALGSTATVKPTADSISSTLASLMQTDDGRIKIAQIEADVEAAFKQLQVKSLDELAQLEQIEAADRQSARTMASTKDIWTPRILAAFVCGSSTFLLVAIIKGWTSGESAVVMNLLSTLIGFVFRDVAQVLNFYFGTSSGSEDKTKLIASLTSKQ